MRINKMEMSLERKDIKSVFLEYLSNYKYNIKNIQVESDDEKILKTRVVNDIENIIKYISYKSIEDSCEFSGIYRIEMFSPEDICDMYNTDEEIFYKNLKTNNFKYLQEVSVYDNSFELIILEITNGKITNIEFIYHFSPLADLFYKNYELDISSVLNKYCNMFGIYSFSDFEYVLNNDFNIYKT